MNWYPSLFRYAFLISKVFCSNDKVGSYRTKWAEYVLVVILDGKQRIVYFTWAK